MKKFFTVLANLISFNSSSEEYSVGQIWEHKNNSTESSFRLNIVQIDKHEKTGNIYHLYIEIINPYKENEVLNILHHIPVDKVALDQSLIKLVGTTKNLPDISEGYKIWKEAFDSDEAGVYNISVSEIIQISDEALEKRNVNEENINSKWPDTADGDVFRRMEASGFDFSIEHEIDFNVDFDEWPPSQVAKIKLIELNANTEFHEPDDEYEGYASFTIKAHLEYELVINTQIQVTKLLTPYGGYCDSWGVFQE